jgi:hypothetical protein
MAKKEFATKRALRQSALTWASRNEGKQSPEAVRRCNFKQMLKSGVLGVHKGNSSGYASRIRPTDFQFSEISCSHGGECQ